MHKLCLVTQTLFLTAVISEAFYAQSATMNANRVPEQNSQRQDDEGKVDVPLLPMSDPADESIPTLKFGETLRFEDIGPIIINVDGSTRRIENWDQLSDKEKEVSWRRISKRNEERRKALLVEAEEKANSKINANGDDVKGNDS